MKKASLFLLLLIAVLPCCLLRDFTPDNELRYLSIADEALRNGHIFAFYNHGEPYADKPPLFLWGVMLCRWIAGGHSMALLSLLTLLPAWGVLLVVDKWLAEARLSSEKRQTAMLLVASCGFFPVMALCIRPDMLMCLFIVLALRYAWRFIGEREKECKHLWLFGLCVFMGVFSKGVVGLLMPLATTLAFLAVTRRMRLFSRLWGWRTWLVLLAGCGLWFGLVYREGGAAYIDNLLVHQTVDRAVNAFTHKRPFYYYFVAATYVLAPWTLLLVWRAGSALSGRQRLSDLQKYWLTAILSTIVLLSASSSKLAVYLLPVVPFCAALPMLDADKWRRTRGSQCCIGLPATLLGLAFPAVVAYVCLSGEAAAAWWGFLTGALGLSLCAVAALVGLIRHRDALPAVRTLTAGLFVFIFLGGWSLPALNGETGYGALSRDVQRIANETGIERVGSFRMRRVENIDVYLGQVPREISEEELAADTLRRMLVLTPRRKRQNNPQLFEGKRLVASGKYDIAIFE